MRFSNRPRQLLASFLVGALASISNWSIATAEEGNSQPVDVTIAIAAPAAPFSLAQIASDHNLWPANVQVKPTLMPGTTISVSLAAGKIPLVIGAPPQFEIAGSNINAPLAWIAQWQDPADFQMIVRPGISSVADLKGKVIGTTVPGSSTQLLALVALQKAGLTQHDYSFLAMGDIPSEVAAFYAGTVSALVLPASSLQPIITAIPGTKIVFDFYEQKVPWLGAGVVAYRPWAEKNAGLVVGLLSSLNQALNRVHSDPSSVEPSISKFVGAQSKASVDLQMKYLKERTLPTLSTVSIDTLKSIYGAAREASGGPGISDAYAQSMADNTYVKKMLESK